MVLECNPTGAGENVVLAAARSTRAALIHTEVVLAVDVLQMFEARQLFQFLVIDRLIVEQGFHNAAPLVKKQPASVFTFSFEADPLDLASFVMHFRFGAGTFK